jgi:hypothetical protein
MAQSVYFTRGLKPQSYCCYPVCSGFDKCRCGVKHPLQSSQCSFTRLAIGLLIWNVLSGGPHTLLFFRHILLIFLFFLTGGVMDLKLNINAQDETCHTPRKGEEGCTKKGDY